MHDKTTLFCLKLSKKFRHNKLSSSSLTPQPPFMLPLQLSMCLTPPNNQPHTPSMKRAKQPYPSSNSQTPCPYACLEVQLQNSFEKHWFNP